MGLVKKSKKYDIISGNINTLVDYTTAVTQKTVVNSTNYTTFFTVSILNNIKARLTVKSQNIYSDQYHDLLIRVNSNTLIERLNIPTLGPYITHDINLQKGDTIYFYLRGKSSSYPQCRLNELKFTYDFSPSINAKDFITGG